MESKVTSGTSGGPARSEPPHHQTARSKRLLEGVLKKYTNLFQGWQNRFFVLDPEIGELQYYLNEVSRSQRPPRGSLPLLGAMVVSSNEFPYMFTIRSTNGNFYKLRALDSQEQELWMTQLQLCSRCLLDASSKMISPALENPQGTDEAGVLRTATASLYKTMTTAEGQQKILANSTEAPLPQDGPTCSLDEDLLPLKTSSAATLSCLGECLHMLQHSVVQVLNQNQNQNHIPNPLVSHRPSGLSHTTPTERSRFWRQRCSSSVTQVEPEGVRSTSKSLTHTFHDSHSSKHGYCSGGQGSGHKHIQRQNQSEGSANAGSPTELSASHSEKKKTTLTFKDPELHSEQRKQRGHTRSPDTPDSKDETTDTEDNDEDNLGDLDDQRSIIFHLLSQLKIGMDLTQVVLPTFILEKRSLLEMYASFMAHPDIFLSITYGCTPEERIIRFVEYYLTAFHEGRRGTVAKKPYNPILGEYFHCSWLVPWDCVQPLRTTSCSGLNSAPTATSTISGPSQGATNCCSREKSDCYLVRFVAEQVSHHPPVSGFYCECKEKRMCVNMHVWTKSKYMGMSVGVSMVGEGVLHLLEHDEEYVFTLPCAYARSILSVPWVELGGKVTINCAKSGYSATVTFHTKPLYGGKVHRVTAEVKCNQTGTIVCKAQGEWNGMLEFSYNSREKKVIDTSKLPIIKKRIRPIEKQGQYESRYLWQHVTTSLKAGNMDTATEHKHLLEERQRREGKHRAATKASWKPKYFLKEGEGWIYHKPLWKAL